MTLESYATRALKIFPFQIYTIDETYIYFFFKFDLLKNYTLKAFFIYWKLLSKFSPTFFINSDVLYKLRKELLFYFRKRF